jgi:2-dehydropantoate 2-reductase
MRIVIVGPGALGSLLTARIALSKEKQRAAAVDNDLPDLCLLDYRPERARQIRKSGLLFEEKGQRTHCTVQVEVDPEVCAGSDVLFLCVKATAVTQALEKISPFLSPDTMLVAMQNGIGHLDAVAALPCISGVGITSEGATLIGPGHVRHGGAGVTRIGILDAETDDAGVKRLTKTAELLNTSGFETLVTSTPLKHIWAKLFINVAINGLTAIHRCPNGELINSQATKDIMAKAVMEAVSIARALDITVEGDPVASAFRVCKSTANNISSMHQDVKNQRQTEIDAINGAVVAHGERLGIPTPVNADLVRQVKRIEASYRI